MYVRVNRQALGLTRTALAQRLGWVQERMSLIERGKYGKPSLPGLARLAMALESPLHELITALGYDNSPVVGPERLIPPDIQRLSLIAHDLGNHMTTAQGRLSLLRQRAENQGDTQCRRDIAEAIEALTRVNRCVRQLVGPARLDHTRDSAPPNPWVLVEGRFPATAGQQSLEYLPE